MSDIVLGALIALGSAILVTIITGIINYKNSTLQINAHHDELRQQHTYDEQQARIDRLIKLREGVLLPLREVVSRWIEASNKSHLMAVRLKTAHERKYSPEEIASEDKLWRESGDKAEQITSELAVLQGKLSDSTLIQMIETAIEAYWETSQEAIKLQFILSNPKDSNTNSLLSVIKEYRSILNKLRGYLLTVNKRIDDLLIGEP
ncbi:hypothetical protein ES703_12900 [subsurface metagenome]